MAFGCNNFNDFPEIVPTREMTVKIEKLFFFSRPWPWAYSLNGPGAATPIAPTLIRHWLRALSFFSYLKLVAGSAMVCVALP